MYSDELAFASGNSPGATHPKPSSGRLIPPAYFEAILKATQQEAGLYSLEMLLDNAGIAEFSPNLAESKRTARASDISRMMQAVRHYYGDGGRGVLNRIGRDVWRYLESGVGGLDKLKILFWPFASSDMRRHGAIRLLERLLGLPKGQFSLHPADHDLILVDRASDPTVEQKADEPVCWYTVGLIQAIFAWATGSEHAVEEIVCRAAGGDACKFRIHSLG